MANNECVEFVYGRYSISDQTLEVLLLSAVLEVLVAKACTTWGQYAAVCDRSWESMLEDWGGEISELTGQEDPAPDAPFRFGDIRGLYYIGDLIPDPGEAAYDHLWSACIGLDDPTLQGRLEWGHGSPAGHICGLSVKHDEDIRLLEVALRDEGYANFNFRRDDPLLAKLVD
jgi:hypothetical protein